MASVMSLQQSLNTNGCGTLARHNVTETLMACKAAEHVADFTGRKVMSLAAPVELNFNFSLIVCMRDLMFL